MKIGLDLRFLKDDLYSAFILELIKGLLDKDQDNNFIIYTNSKLELFSYKNLIIKNIGIKNGSVKEQTSYYQILKKDQNTLMLFFNHYKPIFYSREYITLMPSLKNIYYSDFKNYFSKYSFMYLLEKNLVKSKKILCFDENTSEELIEKYNIEEDKINIIKAFFPNSEKLENTEDLKINIRTKYNLKNDYLIYSGGEGVEKNYEKLIAIFKKINENGKKIDLVFLGDTISRNITLRNHIIDLKMSSSIHFMGVIKTGEKILFYKNSLGVIFPSLYEPFPFRLTEPLYFNIPIISSKLKNIEDIFNDKIKYFSPISSNNIYENLTTFLEEKNIKIDYNKIKEKYKKEKTIDMLIELIK